MDIEELAVYEEIRDFFMVPTNKRAPSFKVRIAVANFDVITLTVRSVDIVRDYGNNIGDYIVVRLTLPFGSYYKLVHDYRDNIEALLYKNTGDEIVEFRFKAVILNTDSTGSVGLTELYSRDELDTMGMAELELQLVDPYVEIIRGTVTGGIFTKTTMKDMLVGVMGDKLKSVKVGNKPYLDLMEVVEPQNEKQYDHILVPDGTYTVDLPAIMQREYGVYNADIGTYFQRYDNRTTCFVYPLFNTKRFDESNGVRKLVVIVLPTTLYEFNENSYYVDGDTVKVVVGESTVLVNDGEKQMMDTGIGFRAATADPMTKKPVEVTEEGPKGKRSSLNTEVIDRERADGVNITPVKAPSSNQLKYFSEISRKLGNLLTFDWRYSDPELIYPNMPVKVIFDKGQDVKEINGVVQQTHSFFTPDTHITTNVVVFVEKDKREDQ